MAKLLEHDPNNILIAFNGITLEAFEQGSMVVINPSAEAFTERAGADGTIARAKTNNRLATCTFNLLSNSPSNVLLTAMYNADISYPSGAGVGVLLVTERNTGVQHIFDNAWIKSLPSVEMGNEITTTSWEIAGGPYRSVPIDPTAVTVTFGVSV